MKYKLTQLKTDINLPKGHEESYRQYIKSMEVLLEDIIPKEVFPKNLGKITQKQAQPYFEKLNQNLPLVVWSPVVKTNEFVSVSTICFSNHTHGMGRFMCDLFSRWLIPGKQMPILNVRSLNFVYELYPEVNYFANSLLFQFTEPKDYYLIKTNLPIVAKELKLNILAVQHTRHVVSIKPLTLDQKKILIQENIASLLDRSSKEIEASLFEQTHQLLVKASAEEKITQIKDQLEPLLQLRPTAFDRDIFSEIQKFVTKLKDNFVVIRDLKHLNRIISYQYIFRKIQSNLVASNPQKRHVSLKVLRTNLTKPNKLQPILGIIVGLNLINDNELFDEKHLFKAIQTILPDVHKVESSAIVENSKNDRIITAYLEITKPNEEQFTPTEIKQLKTKLTREIKNAIECVMNTIFIHRNEEEVMRNILDLSKQLKYVHDLPQVIVNFHKQTAFEISFIVILVRLIKPNELGLQEVFSSSNTMLKFFDHDVRMVGILRKRYPKEANVLEVRLDKKQFLRKDFSLDLYQARLCIISEITRMIGDVRDYNGGMIAKQHEVLSKLKELLIEESIRNDFLLENFFYSLTPNYMQSLLSPFVLKELFMMLLNVLEHDFNKDTFYVKTQVSGDYYLMMLGALQPSFRKFISKTIDNFLTSSHELSHSYINVYDISCVGFLLRYDNPQEHEIFEKNMLKALSTWEKTSKDKANHQSPYTIINQLTS